MKILTAQRVRLRLPRPGASCRGGWAVRDSGWTLPMGASCGVAAWGLFCEPTLLPWGLEGGQGVQLLIREGDL